MNQAVPRRAPSFPRPRTLSTRLAVPGKVPRCRCVASAMPGLEHVNIGHALAELSPEGSAVSFVKGSQRKRVSHEVIVMYQHSAAVNGCHKEPATLI